MHPATYTVFHAAMFTMQFTCEISAIVLSTAVTHDLMVSLIGREDTRCALHTALNKRKASHSGITKSEPKLSGGLRRDRSTCTGDPQHETEVSGYTVQTLRILSALRRLHELSSPMG